MEPDITTESSSVMTYGGYSAAGVRVPRAKNETRNNIHKAIVPNEEDVEELNPSNDGSGYSAAGIRLPSNADRNHNKSKRRSRKPNKQDDEVMTGPKVSSSSHFAALKSMSDSTRHLDEFFAQKTPPYTITADNGTYASGDRAAGGAASANHHPSRLSMNNTHHLHEDDARGLSIRPRQPSITREVPSKTNTRKVFPNFGTLSMKSADYSDTTITVSADLRSRSEYDDETTDTSIRSAKKIESLLLFQKPDLSKQRDDHDIPTFSTRWNKMKSGSLKFNNDRSLLDLSELSTSPPTMKAKTSNSRTPMFTRGRGSVTSIASSVVSDLPYVPPRKEGLIPTDSSSLLQSKQFFARESSGFLSTGQASSEVSDVPRKNEGMIFNTMNIGTAQLPHQLSTKTSAGKPTVQVSAADAQFTPPRMEGLIPHRTIAHATPSEQFLSRDSSGRSTAYSSRKKSYATRKVNDSFDKFHLNDSRHASASSLTVASSVVSELPYIPPRKPGLIPESPHASIFSTTSNAEWEPEQPQHDAFISRNPTPTTCYSSPPQQKGDSQFDGIAYKKDKVQRLREGIHPYESSKQPKEKLIAASTFIDQLGISAQDATAIPTPKAEEQSKYQPHSGSAKWDKSSPPQGTIFPSRATTSAYCAEAVSSEVSDVPRKNEGMILNTMNIGTAQLPHQLSTKTSAGKPTVQVSVADAQFTPPRMEGLIPHRTIAHATPSEQLLSRDSSGRSTAYSSGKKSFATRKVNDSFDKFHLNDSRHASASSLTVASSVVSELPYIPPRKPGLIPESPHASIFSTTSNAEWEPEQPQHEAFISRNPTPTTCYLSPPQQKEDSQFDGIAYKKDKVQRLREGIHPYESSKQPKEKLIAASTFIDQLGISAQDATAIPTPIAEEQSKYQPHSGSAKWDKSSPPQGTIFPSRATTSAYCAEAVPVCEQHEPKCDDYIENYLTQRDQNSKDQEEGLRGISRDVSNKTKSLSSRWTEPASSLTIASSIVSDLPNIHTIKELAKTEANDSTEIPEERVNNRQVAIDSLPFASPWPAGAIPLLSHTDQPKEAMSRNHDSATSVASDIGSNVQAENPLIIDHDKKSTFLQNLPALRKLQKHVSDITDWDNSNTEADGALSNEASIKINSQDNLGASMTDELEACKKYLSIDNEDIGEDFGCHIDPSEQKRDKLRVGRNLVVAQGNTVGVSDLTISSALLNESSSTIQNSSWYGPTLVCVEEVSCYNSDAEIDKSANNPSRHHIRESPYIVDKPAQEESLSAGGDLTHINSQFVLCDSQSIEKKPSNFKKAPFYDKEGDLAAGISPALIMNLVPSKLPDFVQQNDSAATASAEFAISSNVDENSSTGSRSDQLESYERKELIEDKSIDVPGLGFPCMIPSSNQQESGKLDETVGDLAFDHESLDSLGKPLSTSICEFSKKVGDDSSNERNDSYKIDDLIPLEGVSPFALEKKSMLDSEDYGDSNFCTLHPRETVPIETLTGKIAPDLHLNAPHKIESGSIDDNALCSKEQGTASLHSAEESGSVEAASSRVSNIMLDDDFILEVDFPTKASDFENIGDLDVSFPSLEARRTLRQKIDSSDDSEKREESVHRSTPQPLFVAQEHVPVESNQNIEGDVDVIIPLIGSDHTEDLSAESSNKTRSRRNSSQKLSSSSSSPRELYERDEVEVQRNTPKPIFEESLPANPTEETNDHDLDEHLNLVKKKDSRANDKGSGLLNSMRSSSSRSWSSKSLSSTKSSSSYSPLEDEEKYGVLSNPPLLNDSDKGHHFQPSIKQQRREDLYNSGFVDEGIVIETNKERPGLNDGAYDRKSFMRDFNDDYAMGSDEESGSFDAVSVLASLHERPDPEDEHSRTTEGKVPTFFVETLKRLTKPCRPMTCWKYAAFVALLFFIVGVIVVAVLLIPRSSSENVPASNNPPITSPSPSNNYSTFETSEWIESSIGAYAFSLPGDGTGFSVSLSGKGDRLAVGSPYLDTSYGTRAGLVALYEGYYENNETLTWTLIGKLYGNVSGQEFGISVSMNDDGGVLSVGSLKSGSSTGGLVQVFQIHDPPPSIRKVRYRSLTRNRSPKDEVSEVSSNGAEANRYEMLSNYALSQIGQTLQQEDSVSGDYYGYSLSLSSTGDVLAVGAPKVGNNSGRVFAYSYDNSTNIWTNIYLDNSTAVENDLFGWSVAISGDGTMVAAGAPQQINSAPGYVVLYNVDNGALVHTISSRDARATSASGHDDFGFSVSLDYTGKTVAIGSPNSTTSSSTSGGYAAVFSQTPSSSQWTLMGGKILEGSTGDALGYSIALSHDGTLLATGTPKSANNVGAVRIYNFTNATTWEMAPAIQGGVTGGDFGSSTSLSADGTRCAVGVPFLSSCSSSSSKTACTAGTSLIFDSPANIIGQRAL